MATDTFFPAFTSLIFFPEQLMPDGCVQFWVQGQNGLQEIITTHSAVMDRPVSRADHMTWPIFRQAAALLIVGTFLLR